MIPEGAIKTLVPMVRQGTKFSCGASSFHAVAMYWGVEYENEFDYFKELKTNKKGTKPQNITKLAKEKGLKTIIKENMTIKELKAYLNEFKPVILAIQAWGNKKTYNKNYSGHYVVACGFDKKNIYFIDPSLGNKKGYLSCKELEKRWHDKDYDGDYWDHLGIVVWKNTEPPFLTKARKIL